MKSESHEFPLLLTNGKVLHFTLHELHSLFRHRYFIAFLLSALLIIVLMNPLLFPAIPSFSARAFYWGVCLLVYVLILPSWVRSFYFFWQKITSKPAPLLLGSVVLASGLTVFSTSLPYILGDWLPDRGAPIGWRTVLIYIAICHTLEMIALTWLLPRHRLEQAELENVSADDEIVVLNGQTIPLSEIQHVQSAEHYVVVTTKDGPKEYRARMKDFLGQVTEEQGLQTHRSHWVSVDAATKLKGNVVVTNTGHHIPVSRGKLKIVRSWLSRQS